MNDFENNVKKALNDRVDEQVGPRRSPPAFDPTGSATRHNGGTTGSRWLRPLLAAAAVVAVAIGATLTVNDMSNTHRVTSAIPGTVQTATASPTATATTGPTTTTRPVPTATTRPLPTARPTATTRPVPTATTRPLPTARPTTTTSPTPTTSPTSPSTPTTPAASPSPTLTFGLPGAPPCQADIPGANVPGIRPALIFIGCATSADMLKEISWSSWTTTAATGKATHGVNDCKPSCAQGTYTYFPVNVGLSQPARVKGMLIFQTIVMSPAGNTGRIRDRNCTLALRSMGLDASLVLQQSLRGEEPERRSPRPP